MNIDRKRAWWYTAAALFLAVYILIALLVKPGPALTALADITRFLLSLIAIFTLGGHLFAARGRERAFWGLMTLGAMLWSVPHAWRIWYEVLLRNSSSEYSLSHIFLFLHVIPLMAALALRPQYRQSEHKLRMDFLDAVMLLLWWIYLYLFMITPWQLGMISVPQLSGFYFNVLYFVENAALATGAGILFLRSARECKKIYGGIFLSATLYTFGSLFMDWHAIHRPYQAGSVPDVLIVAAMLVFAGIGLEGAASPYRSLEESVMGVHSVWPARFALLALISMPCMALWIIFFSRAPYPVTIFRLQVAFGAIVVLTLVVMFRQMLLNAELTRLLRESQQTITHEKRLQDRMVSSEKMAALGQLVAGAAHEINNPLTAILGYSDLLEADASLSEEPRSQVQKIGQQARRTKRLVENLLNFAQQSPAEKTSVHVNALLNNALQLREPDLSGKRIKLKVKLEPELPRIRGDSNQLLQVFLHMINNAADALQEVGGGLLTITTNSENAWVLIQFSDTGVGIKEPQKIFDPFYTTKPIGKGSGLGLSACYGIVQDHGGKIECENNANGGATFLIKLPAEATPQQNTPPPEAPAGK
ncbi:MAG TPA: ATP-binding protein [Terriglobales bacterium]|jgi:signal transduction histidine kinase|nr:ATP-binding protein [Terriglobales bacterium]